MFLLQHVITIHDELIIKYGGSLGVRDVDSLKSALNRPFQYFSGIELYPTAEMKAAALIQSIILNHPFVDGNKRIAYFLSRSLLLHFGFDITASEDEKYDFVVIIAQGKLSIEEITKWFASNIKRI